MLQKYKEHYKYIIKLGVPIVIGQIGVVLVGFIDNIMVGRFATEDLATASFVNNLFNIAVLFGFGFAYGLTPLVGSSYGGGDNKSLGFLLKNSLLLNFIIGIFLSFVMFIVWLNVEKLRQPQELIPLVKPYFLLHIISMPFLMLFNSLKQFFDGITDTKTPMYIMLIANAINVVFNAILIYGVGPIPALGVFGAGLSTLFSRIFMFVALAYIFFNSKKFSIYKESYQNAFIRKEEFLKLNKMGWMIGLQMGMETALFSLTAVMIGWLGKIELAAHQVLVTLSTLGFMVYYGVGAAVAVRVSNYCGRKDIKNIRLTVNAGFQIILLLALFTSILFLLIRTKVGYLFTEDVAIVDIVSMLLFTLVAYQIGDGLQITFANALRGISDVVAMAIISFIGYFLIAIPTSYFCGFVLGWGIQGVWIGYPLGLTLTGVIMWLRFRGVLKTPL